MVKEDKSMVGILPRFIAAIAVSLMFWMGCPNGVALAEHERIPDALALQLSFNIWAASTVQPGQKVEGTIRGYHIECIGGGNRVPNSNTRLGDGTLGIARAGAPRRCTGYKEGPTEAPNPSSLGSAPAEK